MVGDDWSVPVTFIPLALDVTVSAFMTSMRAIIVGPPRRKASTLPLKFAERRHQSPFKGRFRPRNFLKSWFSLSARSAPSFGLLPARAQLSCSNRGLCRFLCPAPLATRSSPGGKIPGPYSEARQPAARARKPAGRHPFLWVRACNPLFRWLKARRGQPFVHVSPDLCRAGLSFHSPTFFTARRKSLD